MWLWLIRIFFFFPTLGLTMPVTEFPPALMVHDKPIDPLCFGEMQKETLDINHCGLHAKKRRVLTGRNQTLLSKGFMGYDYQWTIDNTLNTRGYSYYKVIGTLGKSVMVETLNNFGGSGIFTSIDKVVRQGHQLHAVALAGGDRCNGGIHSATIIGQGTERRLVYQVNMTSFAMFNLLKENRNDSKPYDDLADCAICCIGTAVFQRQEVDQLSKEKLLYVDLDRSLQGPGNSSVQSKKQDCFSALLNDYLTKQGTKMNPLQLKQFIGQFNARCIHT